MLAVNQENEKLMEEYEKLASDVRLGPGRALPLPTLCFPDPGCPAKPRPGPVELLSPG